MSLPAALAIVLLGTVQTSPASERVDLEMLTRIREEGFERSRVMEVMEALCDEIGPRLTGSPAMRRANEWTRDTLEEWGLENAHLEAWGPFGRGWSFDHCAVHVLAPRRTPVAALPLAWTPGTDGPVRGAAIRVTLESEEDLEKWAGKLAGKVLFLDEAGELHRGDEAPVERYEDGQLEELVEFRIPGRRRESWRERARKRYEFRRKLREFCVAEEVLALARVSSRDSGLLRVGGGGSREPDEDPGVPAVMLSLEPYNWILRLLEDQTEVELEIDVAARFHDEDLMAYNTVAELPGAGSEAGLVMVGAHLDSWHAGTGATDNAAGCAVAMEALRILHDAGARPRRTIRVALWSGEEQGLLGSKAYVAEHFASRPEPENPPSEELPEFLREPGWPLEPMPAHGTLSAYFNLDNGSGKIRGVYTQGNAALVPVFSAWLEPLRDLGAHTVTNNDTGGTDHLSFDAVGLPGFQFIQDGLDYSSRTHHTQVDVLDHVEREDLMQASVVMAAFLYQAASREDRLPRKPFPRPPPETAPAARPGATESTAGS
jgi:hypothetical protein